MNRYKFDDKNHIHLLDDKPLIGTTTALNVLAKVLTWWASGLAVKELGWTNPKEVSAKDRLNISSKRFSEIKALNEEEYLTLLDKAYRAHSVKLDKSADAGTDMHAELERYVKNCINNNDGFPEEYDGEHEAVKIFYIWAKDNVKKFLISEGHAYNESLWIGGILDLLYEDKDGRLVILDFKSAKEAYMSHFFQCGGNDLEISESGVLDKDGNLIYDLKGRKVEYYGVFPFGAKNPKPEFHYDTNSAKEGFQYCVGLHKILNK